MFGHRAPRSDDGNISFLACRWHTLPSLHMHLLFLPVGGTGLSGPAVPCWKLSLLQVCGSAAGSNWLGMALSTLHQCRCFPLGLFYCDSIALPQDGSAGLMSADSFDVEM